MKTLNNDGPSTLPCGTPDRTGLNDDLALLMHTEIERFSSHDDIQSTVLVWTPMFEILIVICYRVIHQMP